MRYWLPIIAISVVIVSCGGEISETAQALKNVEQLSEAANDIQAATDKYEQRRQERIKKGDTIAIPYKDLQAYLPASVSGYTAGEPDGETVNMPGMSTSTASREYTKGNDNVRVEIMDFNGASGLWIGATAVFKANLSMEDDDQKSGSFQTGNEWISGWEEYQKKGKDAKVMYMVGDRFMVTVSASNQSSTDFCKSVGKSIDLKKLAGL